MTAAQPRRAASPRSLDAQPRRTASSRRSVSHYQVTKAAHATDHARQHLRLCSEEARLIQPADEERHTRRHMHDHHEEGPIEMHCERRPRHATPHHDDGGGGRCGSAFLCHWDSSEGAQITVWVRIRKPMTELFAPRAPCPLPTSPRYQVVSRLPSCVPRAPYPFPASAHLPL